MTTLLRPNSRNSAFLLLTALLMLPSVGTSAGVLGEPLFVSRIGEPLRIEIPLVGGDGPKEAECLRIPPGPAAVDGIAYVRGARLSVTGRGNDAKVVVSHRLPSFEPALRFAIEDICDSRLRRDYTVLLAFPDQLAASANGEKSPAPVDAALEDKDSQSPARAARRARESVDQLPSTVAPEAPPRARRARAAASTRGGDRLELGGGESELPGAGLRLSTQLGSLTRIEATSEAQREQLRQEQLMIMALDRSIVAQLELNERIRQLEAVQARILADARARGPAAATPAQAPADSAPEPETAAGTSPAPLEPDHSVAETWKRWTITIGVVSLALAAILAWMRRRREQTYVRQETEHEEPVLRPREPVTPRVAAAGVQAPEPAAAPFQLPEITAEAPEADLDSFERPAERVPLGWETAEDAFAHPAQLAPIEPIAPLAPPLVDDETAEEHESAIELAEIMMGFGRIRGAADTLAEFIASNPKKAVTPWLKLMEVYRAADLREEFDALAQQLNKTFNVKAVTWDSFDEAKQATQSMEQMAHVIRNVQQMWGTTDCQAYLEHLLRDNRDGTREGFPLSVIDEILTLESVLEDQLGPYRPPVEPPSPAQGEASEATQLF